MFCGQAASEPYVISVALQKILLLLPVHVLDYNGGAQRIDECLAIRMQYYSVLYLATETNALLQRQRGCSGHGARCMLQEAMTCCRCPSGIYFSDPSGGPAERAAETQRP